MEISRERYIQIISAFNTLRFGDILHLSDKERVAYSAEKLYHAKVDESFWQKFFSYLKEVCISKSPYNGSECHGSYSHCGPISVIQKIMKENSGENKKVLGIREGKEATIERIVLRGPFCCPRTQLDVSELKISFKDLDFGEKLDVLCFPKDFAIEEKLEKICPRVYLLRNRTRESYYFLEEDRINEAKNEGIKQTANYCGRCGRKIRDLSETKEIMLEKSDEMEKGK